MEGVEVHQLKTFNELFTTGADEGVLDCAADVMLPDMFDSAILLHSSGMFPLLDHGDNLC